MVPSLAAHPIGVALVGEALGEHESEQGRPFVGPAGFKLTRLVEWAGFTRDQFDIFNTVWCRPPNNKLEGQPYEIGAIEHCRRAHWGQLLERSSVVVPMGNVPFGAFMGGRKGILSSRGYVSQRDGKLILPTVHPAFIQRGQSKWSAPFVQDIQKAVQLAQTGYPNQVYDYVLDPSPMMALRWAQDYRAALMNDPSIRLAYDIETPYKDEDESGSDDDIREEEVILRIGFSYRPYTALSIPFDGAYRAAINLLLESPGDKVVWNGSFDTPRLRRQGCQISGHIHDGMVAWHVLHSDLPKGLGFVATFTCPYQEEWKHLSSSRPAFYNATDADVELRSMIAIEAELRRTGLWAVYDRDVLQLEPILEFMSATGMPIDQAVREQKALLLTDTQQKILQQLTDLFPREARKVQHVYRKPPKVLDGLVTVRAIVDKRKCSICGGPNPLKSHFKATLGTRKAPRPNPCAAGVVVKYQEESDCYARLGEFKPSRDQLIRYNQALNRPLPTVYDKASRGRKVSMNEKSLRQLMEKYPEDKLYPLVLTYRELDKISSTYIGRHI